MQRVLWQDMDTNEERPLTLPPSWGRDGRNPSK